MIASILVAMATCSVAFSPLLAQEPRVSIPFRESPGASPGPASSKFPTIRVDSDLVLVPVLVRDRADRVVTGLAKQDFRVFDDGIQQEISHFAADDVPISVALVFDTSNSMANKLRNSRMAAGEFLRAANPGDEFLLVEFNDRARVATKFTNASEEIQNRLTFSETRGETALLDAICLALNEMKHARNTRKALLVISDGGDNSSRYGQGEVRQRVKEADVQIYSIGIVEPLANRWRSPEEESGPRLLKDFSDQSGGWYFEVEDAGELSQIAAKIGFALRNQYILGYSPSPPKRDGRYHRIAVRVEQPQGLSKLRPSFRPNYLAPGQ